MTPGAAVMPEIDDSLILARALEQRLLTHKQFLQLMSECQAKPGSSMLEAALAHGWLSPDQLEMLMAAPTQPVAPPSSDNALSPGSAATLAQPNPVETLNPPPPAQTLPGQPLSGSSPTLVADAAPGPTQAANVVPFTPSHTPTRPYTPATIAATPGAVDPTPAATGRPALSRDRSPLGPPTDASALRYDMKKQLARGGMGAVWLARDPAIERDVAVKELLPNALRSAAMVDRFREEARLTGQLEHPGIVPIHELGTKPDGAPFYVMKLLSGRSFYQAVQEYHKLPADDPARVMRFSDLLRVFVGICEAMAFAHSKGVIHRDLKPANVMVGDFGEAVVVDWGLAKPLGQPGAPFPEGFSGSGSVIGSRPSRTVVGSTLGTPSYMPPEQARGDWDQVDTRSDIFSLGAILFEVLTGQPPYKADDLFEILDMAHAGRVPAPRSIKADVAPELEAVALRALAAEPGQRYQTAMELAEEVKRFQAGEPVQAYPEPWTKRANRWLKKNRALAGSIAMGIAAVMALGVAWWAMESRRFAAVALKADEFLVTGRTQLGDDRPEAALAALGQAAGLIESERGLAHRRDEVRDLKSAAEAKVRAVAERHQRAEQLARFRRDFDDALFYATGASGHDRSTNRTLSREAATRALAVCGLNPEAPTVAFRAAGFSPNDRSELEQSCRTLWLLTALTEAQPIAGQTAAERKAEAQDALDLLDRGKPLGLPAKAVNLVRAYAKSVTGDPAANAERAIAEQQPATTADDFFLGGYFALTNDDYGKAIREFDSALRLRPDYFWASALSGLAYAKLPNRAANALPYLTSAIQRRPGLFWLWTVRGYVTGLSEATPTALDLAEADFREAQRLSPESLAVFVNRAAVRTFHGRFDEAAADLNRARQLAPRSPQVAAATGDLARKRGQSAEAAKLYDEAIQLAPAEPQWLAKRALLRESQGKIADALTDLTRAVELLPPGEESYRVQYQRAKLFTVLKQYRPALEVVEAVIAAAPDYADAHCLRGELLAITDRREEAIAAFDRYLELTRDPSHLVGDRTAYRDRGLMRLLKQDYAGGVADLDRFLAIAPAEPNEFDKGLLANARRRRGWTLLNRGALLAVTDFDKALQLEPRSADALNGRGYARAVLGEFDAAVADADAAVTVADADNPDGRQRANVRFNAACVYAEVASRDSSRATKSKDKVIALLRQGATLLTPEQRMKYGQLARDEKAFAALKFDANWQQLLRDLEAARGP